MSETLCKNCNKPVGRHKDIELRDGTRLQVCVNIQEFDPADPPPVLPSFKLGDWVTRTMRYQNPADNETYIGPIESFLDNGYIALKGYAAHSFDPKFFRLATTEERLAVTHFTPQIGMILQYRNNYEHPVFRVYQIETIPNQVAHTYRLDDAGTKPIEFEHCTHENFEILDRYALKGCAPVPAPTGEVSHGK